MNKHKKNLESLRRHLGRDAAGLALLDQIARDLSELRKRVAALDESECQALACAARDKENLTNAQAENAKVTARLEKENGRRLSAEAHAARSDGRVATLEQNAEVEDEAPLEGAAQSDRYAQEIATLSKAVRKRFKRVPPPRSDRAVVWVEDVAPNLTTDELLGLGMLVAVVAVHGFPIAVKADRTMKDVDGWSKRHGAKFIRWVADWISHTPTEDKIQGPRDRGVTREAKPW